MDQLKRLDLRLVELKIVPTRSRAENLIKLKKVLVNDSVCDKPSQKVGDGDQITINDNQYVSRAAYKLESVIKKLNLNFYNKKILDIGSSTGGFTELALKLGASKVIDIEIGNKQLHPSLRGNPKIILYENTDINDVLPFDSKKNGIKLDFIPDIVLMDISFTSIREVIDRVVKLIDHNTILVVMAKPQFEAKNSNFKHKGIIKNEKIRRQILKDFEDSIRNYFIILNKADSLVSGSKGNVERFYLLKKLSNL